MKKGNLDGWVIWPSSVESSLKWKLVSKSGTLPTLPFSLCHSVWEACYLLTIPTDRRMRRGQYESISSKVLEELLDVFPHIAAAAAAKLLQSCPTLCDPIDSSPPGSPVPGILQARTLEWVAISFSHARKWKVKVKLLSRVWFFATPWTAAYQAPPSMGLSRQ